MRLCKAVACWVVLGLIPSLTFALGLGDIRLESALNQPFSAEVPLESLEEGQLNELTVSMASREAFQRYGLDRPEFLNDFSFLVTSSENGEPVIRIASRSPVAEPFVTLLLDVKWRSGRLQREYTVLLDPPVFEDIAARSVPAQTVAEVPAEPEPAPVEAEPVVSGPVMVEAEQEPAEIIQSAQQSVEAQEALAGQAAEEPVEAEPVAEQQLVQDEIAPQEPEPAAAELPDSYTTANGDTLWSIAARSKPAELTTNQMMLAIYRANPDAFRGNINALQAGAILRLPPSEEAEALSVAEAEAEARQQHSSWSGQKQVEPEPDAVSDGPQLELVPPASDFAADEQGQGAATEADADTGTQVNELAGEPESSEGLLTVTDPEMEALQERIAAGESAETTEGLEIGEIGEEAGESETDIVVEGIDEPLQSPFADEAELLEDDSVFVDEEAVVETAPVEEPPAAQPVEDLTGQQDGSIISMLMDYAIWIGAALLVLIGLFFARRRVGSLVGARKGEAATEAEPPSFEESARDFSNLPSVGDAIVVDEGGETFESDDADTDVVPERQVEPEPEPASSFDDFSSTIVDDTSEVTPGADAFGPADTISDGVQDTDAPDETTLDRIDDEGIDLTASLEQLSEEPGTSDVETPLEKTISTGAPLNLDQADPIAEADFHMAYGLYDQAADLLVKALEEDKGNRDFRVKLLEVYFVWENKDGFLAEASALHDSIGDDSDPDWNKVLILGKQLCPDADLFSGGAAVAPVADAMDFEFGEDEGEEMDLDLSLGGNEVQALEDPSEDTKLDFDLGADTSVTESSDDDFLLDLNEADAAAEGKEKPPATVKLDDDDMAATLESPTIDASGPDAPTIEADMLGATLESPTLEMPEPTSLTAKLPALEELGEALSQEADTDNEDSDSEDSASLDVDLSGLADFTEPDPDASSAMDIDSTLNQLDNTGELLKPEDVEDFSRTLVEDNDATEVVNPDELDSLADNQATEIFSSDDEAGDTAEQPTDSATDTAEQPGLDESFDDFPEGAIPGDATMTEVGTKLDLARAYIDMGDPDGARSILKEVLDEGGEPQQQQARQLLEELGG